MTEKYRVQFRFLNGFIPPEMVVDVSEMGVPSACRNLFAIANAHNWQGEVLVLELNPEHKSNAHHKTPKIPATLIDALR